MIVQLGPWVATNAIAFCRSNEIHLRPEGESLLREGMTPREFYATLRKQGNYADARRVLAHFLPKRRALWWACLCTRKAYGPELPSIVQRVLDATVQFIIEPDDGNRRALLPLYREAKPNTLAGCLSMAVFCSGGSLLPAHLHELPPKPFVTGRLVGVTIYLASVLRKPSRYRQVLREFLDVGEEIARGRLLWVDQLASQHESVPTHSETSSAPPLPDTQRNVSSGVSEVMSATLTPTTEAVVPFIERLLEPTKGNGA